MEDQVFYLMISICDQMKNTCIKDAVILLNGYDWPLLDVTSLTSFITSHVTRQHNIILQLPKKRILENRFLFLSHFLKISFNCCCPWTINYILPPSIFDHNQYSIGPGNVLVVTLFDLDIVFARIICLQWLLQTSENYY